MRIAILGHVRQPIAPPFSGGMEALTWHLADGLTARGHDVVLFASGDSDPRFRIDAVLPRHYDLTYPWHEHRGSAPLIAHVDGGYAAACDRIAAGGFDVVHNNSLSRLALERRRTSVTPTLTSLHVPPFDGIHWFVRQSPAPSHLLTVTSHAQLGAWWPDGAPPEASVLHNGIDPAAWPFRPEGNGEAVWFGRITPTKGPHLAIRAARRAGIPLTLFGLIEERGYWETEVEPLLGGAFRYGGHLDGAALAAEVGARSVLLFTPCWDEPFGLVAIEAMSCGLPVAFIANGAAPEVVAEAGIAAPPDDADALAAAIPEALAIPRTVPRARVERLFTHTRWLERCEFLYRAAIAGRSAVADAAA